MQKKNSQMEVRKQSIITSEEEEEEQNSTLKTRRIPKNYGVINQKTMTYWCGFRLKDARFLFVFPLKSDSWFLDQLPETIETFFSWSSSHLLVFRDIISIVFKELF